MKYCKILGLTIIATAATLTACTEDLANVFNSGHEIAFEIKTNSESNTRAASPAPEIEPVELTSNDGETFYLHTDITPMPDPVIADAEGSAATRGATKDATNLQSDGFVVSAYKTTDGTTRGDTYFEYKNATYASSKFTPQSAGSAKYWPAGKLMFYAYYPAATGSNGLATGSNASVITYTVPQTPANQPDLMTAKLDNQQYVRDEAAGGTRELSFSHALCAIKFQTGTDIAGGTINSITLNNVYTSGTYNLDNNTWSDTSAGNVSYTGLNITTTEGVNGTDILTSSSNLLMLIPQTFTSDDQKITISFTDASSIDHTLSCSLKGTSWTRGQCITYSVVTEDLVTSNYTLAVTGGSTTYSGGTVPCSITSYRTVTETGEDQVVAWSVVGYSTDGGSSWSETKPDWLTLASTSGSGSVSATTVNATVDSSPVVTTEAALSTATPKGSSTDYFDLSTHDVRGDETLRNTANCYVVNAPGYYKFPVVYGNAIKNGAVNTSAYHTNNSGANVLSNFVDHNNNAIYTPAATDPYINLKYNPDNAVLVWQDVNGMVSDISYDSDAGYIKFHIASDKIAQGNAVIALLAGTTILWSWHIWATPKDIANTIPVETYNTSYTYNMMSINLGWCATTNTSSYATRYALIKIRQAKSGKTENIKVSQYSDSGISTTGNSVFYQGGRKDPMLPGGSAVMEDKPYWGEYTWTRSAMNTQASVATTIQNPFTAYIVSDGNWCSSMLFNLWDVNNTQADWIYTNVTKTIYDPSPAGFKVPPGAAYTGFTKTGENSTTASQYNIKGSYDSGYWFYTKRNNSDTSVPTIFFPAYGARDSFAPRESTTGRGQYFNIDYGHYHTAHLSQNGAAHGHTGLSAMLFFGPSRVDPKMYNCDVAYPCSIRPIEE